MKEYKGLAISSGKVVSKVCLYSQIQHKSIINKNIKTKKDVAQEIKRFENAVLACSTEMDEITEKVRNAIGDSEAEIYIAQKHIMNDPVIINEIKKRITQEKKNAEVILDKVYSEYEEKFANLSNEYISERSSDINEIRMHLLNYLLKTQPGFDCEGQEHCYKGRMRVIVAKELTTDMMVNMNLKHVYGIVTEHGGINSHAAIIARAAGIPAVSGAIGIYRDASCGDEVLVDSDSGTVIINPDKSIKDKIITEDAVEREKGVSLSTPKGMQVLANASLIEDVELAASMHADGIGLFRTELSFMRAQRLLTEDEQFDFYSKVIRLMVDRPINFRLLDVGGDKELTFLKNKGEKNPNVSLRGARFLLANHDILYTQVRALLRLSKFCPIRILIPMIVDIQQLDKILAHIKEIMKTINIVPENIQFGVMFEVPSACLQAEEIYKMVDFGCIGSNDLIQYLFALDRDNELVSQDFNLEHQVLWSIMKNLSDTAKKAGKPLSICGEIAGKKSMVTHFLKTGITSLSVSPRLIPRIRNEMENCCKENSNTSNSSLS